MKLIAAALLALALPAAVHAQDSLTTAPTPAVEQEQAATPVPPPMEPGVIYLVEGESLRKLESVPLDKDQSVGGLGALMSVATLTDMTGAQFWGVLAGPTSEVQLTDPQPRFRVRAEKAQAFGIRMGRFAVSGKRRRARIDNARPVDFFDGKFSVGHQITRLEDGVWELQPAKPLRGGEYALCLSGTGPAVDFTIVEAKGKK